MLAAFRQLSHQYLASKNQTYRRYLIANKMLTHPLTIITGQRGIGKTTTLVQHLLDQVHGDINSQSILYIPTDHLLMEGHTLYGIAEQFCISDGKYLAFDEIHQYENWSRELKSITDTFSELQVYASGSSALEIYRGSHDLSRRAIIYNMPGLSLREYIELYFNINLPSFSLNTIMHKHEKLARDIVTQLKKSHQKIIPIFNDYCYQGYYPFAKDLTSPELFTILLQQNVNAILDGDLLSVHPELNGNSIKKIRQVLSFIAGHVPFTPTWTKLKEIVGVADQRTLKNYFNYLENAELIRRLAKAGAKLNKMDKEEKIYLNNSNLLYTLSGENPNKGTLRETFFLSMLSHEHHIEIPSQGDFLIDGKITVEIGGKNKSKQQIYTLKNTYRACDDIEIGIDNKIPLWLFGFLY